MASRDVRDLCPLVRPAIEAILDELRDDDAILIQTLRTPEEQEQYIAAGTSWTRRSLHLPQYTCHVCNGLSHAADIAFRSLLEAKGWDPISPLWGRLAAAAHAHGMGHGVVIRGHKRDMPHVYRPRGGGA
jgi:hypothetical protein